MNIPQKE